MSFLTTKPFSLKDVKTLESRVVTYLAVLSVDLSHQMYSFFFGVPLVVSLSCSQGPSDDPPMTHILILVPFSPMTPPYTWCQFGRRLAPQPSQLSKDVNDKIVVFHRFFNVQKNDVFELRAFFPHDHRHPPTQNRRADHLTALNFIHVFCQARRV